MKIPAAKPYFGGIPKISEDIKKVLRSGRLILGPYTKKFEEMFSNYIGVKYAIATSSCTSALEIVLKYIDVKDKEVIVPANTFIACPNSVIYAGGKVVFADSKEESFCIDYEDVLKKITPKTKAVMAVHLAGLPVPELEILKNICKKKKIFLIEDVSHAHGAMINGKKVGSIGDFGCFSFYPTKNMTTGVGGMITTNDKKLLEFAKSVRHHGQGESLDRIVNFGNDWLMDELSAVLGIYQLKRLEKNIKQRNKIAQKYMEGIDKIEGITYYPTQSNIRRTYYKFLAILDKRINKQKFLEGMGKRGLETGTLYMRPCYLHPIYRKFGYKKGACPVTERILFHQISLPMFVGIKNNEIDYVLSCLRKSIKQAIKKTK
jgi:dTDP-4-amino-4,6-dideoxygalactose transaminase